MSELEYLVPAVPAPDRTQRHPSERRTRLSGGSRWRQYAGWRAVATVVLFPLLAACGGSVQGGASQADSRGGQVATTEFSSKEAAQTVEVRVDPSGRLAWERADYTALAGDVTFVVSNPAPLPHEFTIEGQGVKAQSPVFEGGTTNRYTLQGLQPGAYDILCTVPGHHEAGMTAVLHVK